MSGMDWLFDAPPQTKPSKSPPKKAPKKSTPSVACAAPVAAPKAVVKIEAVIEPVIPGTCGACVEYKGSSLAGHGYCRKASSMIDRARFVASSVPCWLHRSM